MLVWVQVPSPADAEVAELADAHGSGPCGSNTMRVQVSFPAWKEALEMGLLLVFSVFQREK